ncbi:LysR substrate-binding domain-containing protein [Pseudovibrio exalbescens]|uniref:LysR family transcriptional regulator n=1 Tax=Pseudovibrio exalbescens TaxID=197461 RepID=UPI00236721B2|nr:LysR family transcriptional regulator [Pseudovibrio exalbescens]MDD7909852.1 LysR substrate-binding domain-containing protein [Pseudovibrio exalbescens]
MDLDALKIAALVATHGSFARVARLKNVDPSSISRSVAGIEEQLALRLFQRSTRRLTLTEEGARYLERIGPLLDEMELAHEEAAAFRQNPTGTLRLTASIAFGSECIVPLLHKLQAQLPNLIVELQLSDSNLDLVENGIDLAIRLTPAPEGELISTRLRTTRYYICVSPDFLKTSPPLATPEDLKEANCLRYALPRVPHVWRFRGKDGNLREISVDGSCSFQALWPYVKQRDMGWGQLCSLTGWSTAI